MKPKRTAIASRRRFASECIHRSAASNERRTRAASRCPHWHCSGVHGSRAADAGSPGAACPEEEDAAMPCVCFLPDSFKPNQTSR